MSYTTPGIQADIRRAFPQLVRATTVRLHPRAASAAGATESSPSSHGRMGPPIQWPQAEPWPVCHEHDDLFVPVLEIDREGVPEVGFHGTNDLFQLLWCPRDHGSVGFVPDVRIFWRRRLDIGPRLAEMPSAREPGAGYVCRPCDVHPERVDELPSPFELDAPTVREIDRWLFENAYDEIKTLGIETNDPDEVPLYQYHFSVAPGTKVGGHVAWIQDPAWPSCDCGRRMSHLLTIASAELDGAYQRWMPVEDRLPSAKDRRFWREAQQATSLMIGDMGSLYVFVCRDCPAKPIKTVMQSS